MYVMVAFGLLYPLLPGVMRAVAIYMEYSSSQTCYELARRLESRDAEGLGSLDVNPRICALFGLEVRCGPYWCAVASVQAQLSALPAFQTRASLAHLSLRNPESVT